MTDAPPSTENALRTLLVVDDNRLITEMVRDFFTPHGYKVLVARNGAEGVEQLRHLVPDVIVADVQMPVMDGWEFCERVREDPATAEVPFVFLTIEGELPQRLRGFHLGADDYVVKPFEIEELHVRVERILERRSAMLEARRGGEALLSGTVEHLAISDLLQILSLNGKDGVVRLTEEGRTGTIVFLGGNIVDAACGRVRGAKALYRMLGWMRATFEVLPPAEEQPARTIEAPASNLIMDGLVSLDEWERWSKELPDRESELALVPEGRDRLEDHRVTAAQFEVLTRAKEGIPLDRMLDESRETDAEIAEAVVRLLDLGVLETR